MQTNTMGTIGYTHGRFQPVHNGHFNTFLKILENYDELWIGIANPLREYPPNMAAFDKELQKSLSETLPTNRPGQEGSINAVLV